MLGYASFNVFLSRVSFRKEITKRVFMLSNDSLRFLFIIIMFSNASEMRIAKIIFIGRVRYSIYFHILLFDTNK